jgi:hypothetical protein
VHALDLRDGLVAVLRPETLEDAAAAFLRRLGPTVAATVPAVTRFAPITIGAALLSAAA